MIKVAFHGFACELLNDCFRVAVFFYNDLNHNLVLEETKGRIGRPFGVGRIHCTLLYISIFQVLLN